jgi:Pyruvate/2-oxoacid:ferredoxin oxidoreductase delta subunit
MLDDIRCKTFLNCFVYVPEQAIEPEQFHLVRFH